MPAFSTVLVANRGEIAARIIRSARRLGLATVAVYTDPDRHAPYLDLADRAVHLGPPTAYLDPHALLDAAHRAHADALHPGYGFLSERHELAAACHDAGITFVGPSPTAIELMGDKARAKARLEAAGVPCLPGLRDLSDDEILQAAPTLDLPLLVKATAGGGGRGLRRVDHLDLLPEALRAARAEARAAFGRDDVLVERLLTHARHIEIQVLADHHGHVLHLGERDCSTQRRYQKVIEEAPSPALDPDLRARMGEAAVDAARAIDYTNAGTVEFLLDPSGDFFFLEMNTRIQVEHPVTELVTGLDLVDLQLHVALGEPLPLSQDDVRLQGHAIEVRLYAEDPHAQHLPQTGTVLAFDPPADPHLRCDHALAPNLEITPHYDPMLAKLMAHGPTREIARRRLLQALRRTPLLGLPTNKPLLLTLLDHPTFSAGEVTTRFLDHDLDLPPRPPVPDALWALAAALHVHGDGWRNTLSNHVPVELRAHDTTRLLHVTPTSPTARDVRWGDDHHTRVDLRTTDGPRLRVDLDGVLHTAFLARTDDALHLELDGHTARFEPVRAQGVDELAGSGRVTSPTSGVVTQVLVHADQAVTPGTPLLTLESMKIETTLEASVAGTVASVPVQPGDQVRTGQVLVVIEEGV